MAALYIVDDFLRILQEVGRWKVIPMKSLYEAEDFKLSYSMFCRKIKKLESDGFIKSIPGKKKKKFLTLTYKGSEYSPYGLVFSEEEDSLNHDLISTNVVKSLTQFKSFKTGQVQCTGVEEEVVPDGLVFAQKNGKEFSLAIEVELHQKSKKRLLDKLSKYSKCSYYNYVLYVFNKESVYRSYKKIIEAVELGLKQKVILLLDESLNLSEFNYEDAICYFKNNETSFEKIFGDNL